MAALNALHVAYRSFQAPPKEGRCNIDEKKNSALCCFNTHQRCCAPPPHVSLAALPPHHHLPGTVCLWCCASCVSASSASCDGHAATTVGAALTGCSSSPLEALCSSLPQFYFLCKHSEVPSCCFYCTYLHLPSIVWRNAQRILVAKFVFLCAIYAYFNKFYLPSLNHYRPIYFMKVTVNAFGGNNCFYSLLF